MSPSIPRRSHLVERAADAARAAIAADAARAAIAADALLARAPRPPLAPVEAVPAAVEPTEPQAPQIQAAAAFLRNELPPVAGALLRDAGLVGETGPAREEIALVREQVLRTIDAAPVVEGRQPRLVVITSTRSGEGKSFVALNLAASIAEGAHRPVILVDAVRDAGSLTELLGLHGASGLAQVRDIGEPDPAGLLRATEVPGLLVLPHGRAQPSGVQGSAMAGALLRLAKRLSDHIIVVDTPACLESSTAGLLATAAGQIALVVQAERTKRAEVEASLDILDACPTLQLLLNRSALQVSDRFTGPAPNVNDVAIGAPQA